MTWPGYLKTTRDVESIGTHDGIYYYYYYYIRKSYQVNFNGWVPTGVKNLTSLDRFDRHCEVF